MAQVIASEGFASFQDYYQNGQLSHFEQKHRRGGSFQVGMMMLDQDPSEFVDPPIDEFSVTAVIKSECRAELDFGDGWNTQQTYGHGFVGPHPPLRDCSFRISDKHYLIVAAVPTSIFIEQFDRIGIQNDPFDPVYGKLDHAPKQLNLLMSMWTAMESGGPANHLLVDGLFTALLGTMLQGDEQQLFASAPDIENRQLSGVIDYIEAHFDTPLLTSELAAIAAMSVAQFGRSFKAATGYSPHQYVTIRRVEHAKRMLCTGELTITQIAYCCGFSSAAHFATVFGRFVGATPSVYRTACCA